MTESISASGAGAEVPEAELAAIEHAMSNDPKDRHVLAGAVVCGADTIITTNTKDFPPSATEPHGITARSPDDFLVSILGPATQDAALGALRNQADFHSWSTAELLDVLGSARRYGPAVAPRYARLIKQGP